MAADESILDHVPIEDKAFPLRGPAYSITGCCPHCGAPVYGVKHFLGEVPPPAKYSCTCYRKPVPVENVMHTK